MQIPVGTEVVILESGITGVVDHYDGSTAYVLAGGDMIQVHKKDIEPVSAFGSIRTAKADKTDHQTSSNRYHGLMITWKAMRSMAGELQHFEVYFHNGTPDAVLLEYLFWLEEAQHTTVRKSIPSGGMERLHLIRPDQMNDRPVSEVRCWRKGSDQVNALIADTEVRLRVKQYIARLQSPEFIKTGELQFEIPVTGQQGTNKEQPKREGAPETDIWKKDTIQMHHEVLQKASMPDYIDLHADKLLPNVRNMEPGEILQFQLRAFTQFLEKAIRLRMHKIYAVHGLGTGRLKQEIEIILDDYPEVTSYNNDYTARFGFGATEIILD